MKDRILTGDRPTGKLHLGHYLGSLKNRVDLQYKYDEFIIIADVQALTTNFETPEMLKVHVRQVAEDYLAAGIDPENTTIFIQSYIPEIAELTVYYSMFTSVNTLRHNPTIKSEAEQRGYTDMTYGFLGYPVSQAADITFCRAKLVPVGVDQLPHIEFARKVARRFNDLYGEVLVEPEALVGEVPRLVGIDGKNKMSKSLNNAIWLSDTPEEVMNKVKMAVTDPARIKKDDPGHPDVCTVYEYHCAFNKEESENVCEMCKSGTIGCVACKKNLGKAITNMLDPINARRQKYKENPSLIDEILMDGTNKAREAAKETMDLVRNAMQISYFKK